MHSIFDWSNVKLRLTSMLTLSLIASVPCCTLIAQETEAKPETEATAEVDEEDASDEVEEEEKDPFEIPTEAGVDELFTFMDGLMQIRPKSRDRAGVTEMAKKVFPTMIKTADLILEKAEDAETEKKAITKKFSAYSILVRYDPSIKSEVAAFAEKYAGDERDDIAAVAVGYLLNSKASGLRGASLEKATEAADETLEFVDRFGISKDTYGTVSSMARGIGYSDAPEVAADLYEKLVPFFEKSSDESMVARAATMMGAARRLRLMDNTIEIFGKTADGEDFAWDDYKGKVVLVDFWASWCGPCIGELPNMKKNLSAYGDKGFEIVGINMDSTREAMDKCVNDKEITWVNIVSDDEENVGWKAPMAQHYGITGIPTAILVNQEGKVVSLRARGSELDKLLEDLLGAAEEPEKEEVAEEEGESASPAALESIK